MANSGTLDGIGVHHMWGFSQSFNCQAMYEKACKIAAKNAPQNTAKPLNILLSQPSDIRHLLKTVAERRRHARRPLHFYIMDGPPEVLARHMLLIAVALSLIHI